MVLPLASRSERGCFDLALPRYEICHPFIPLGLIISFAERVEIGVETVAK